VPGSALTSLFLDDEPEASAKDQAPNSAKDPTKTAEITGNMNAFIDDSAEEEFQSGAKKAQENQRAAPSKKPDPPPENESRKARRRRTRH
jgi:hypothetical protein